VEPRKLHEPFYNKVWALSDEFLKYNFPGNLWNCKCGGTNTDEPVSGMPPNNNSSSADDGLNENPAFTGAIFTIKTHPYLTYGYAKKSKLLKIAKAKADETVKSKKK
jgi:hypothetical protein